LTPSGRRRKHDQDMGRSDKKSSSSTHQQACFVTNRIFVIK